MTAQIVDLDSRRPHLVTFAKCRRCWHEHVAVLPLIHGKPLALGECSRCAAMACDYFDSFRDARAVFAASLSVIQPSGNSG